MYVGGGSAILQTVTPNNAEPHQKKADNNMETGIMQVIWVVVKIMAPFRVP